MSPADLALVLLSALLHAVWSVAIKQSGDPLCFNLLQTWIAAAALACTTPRIPWDAIPAGVWGLLLLAGPAHALYLYWMSRAYEHGELSLVYPIARSTPAFLPLVAVPLFGEALHPVGALGIAVVVGGIWLVHLQQGGRLESRPTRSLQGREAAAQRGEAERSVGPREGWQASEGGPLHGPGLHWRSNLALASPATRFAVLTLLATVACSLIDKGAMAKLAAGGWPSPLPRAVAYSALLWVAHGLAFTPLFFRSRSVGELRAAAREQLALASAAALISFVGYALILRALETALVSYVVAVRQSSVLFAVLLGALWLRERPGRPRIVGAVATVLGVVLIACFS